jgi:hypothetical protein
MTTRKATIALSAAAVLAASTPPQIRCGRVSLRHVACLWARQCERTIACEQRRKRRDDHAQRVSLPYGPADARSRNHAIRNNKEQQGARHIRLHALLCPNGSHGLRPQHHCDIRKADPSSWKTATGVTRMNKIKLALLAAGLLTSPPVLAQTAGGTENTGP